MTLHCSWAVTGRWPGTISHMMTAPLGLRSVEQEREVKVKKKRKKDKKEEEERDKE